MKNNLTIVVNTCDSYSDVLELFFAAMNEYWENCPYPIVINSEGNTYPAYPAITHNFNGDNWGARLIATLESIDTELIIMLYDDFILEAFVDNNKIAQLSEFLMNDPSAAVCYLINTKLSGKKISETLIKVNDNIDYRLNSAPAIWKRKDLLNYTGIYDTPWAWEVFGSYRTYSDSRSFYSINTNDNDLYPYNYTQGGAIYRGKWVGDIAIKKIKKYKLGIDISIRGLASSQNKEKRTLKWKLNFIRLGYKMVGYKIFIFIFRYLKAKIS